MKWLLANTLQRKIMITFTILIFFQILLFGIITYWLDTKSIIKQVSEANLLTLDETKSRLDTEIRVLERVSYQLSYDIQIQNFLKGIRDFRRNEQIPESAWKEQFQKVLMFTNRSWPEISNIYVYNLQGNMVGRTKAEVALPVPRIEDYRNDSVRIDYGIPLGETNHQKGPVVSYLRLVFDSTTGKPLGWVRLDLIIHDMGLMTDLQEDDRTFLVYEPYGKLILSNKPDYLDIVTMTKIINIAEIRGSFIYENNLICYTKSSNTDWRIVSIVPESLLNEGLVQNKIISIVLVTTSFMISIIASTIISFRISRPIRSLYRSMKKVEEGVLSTRVEVASTDEIGLLGNQMNNMLESIDNLINQVYKVEVKYRDAQFNSLLMQINPHFLYNTLEIIDVLSLKGKQREVSQTIYSLTSMFRYVLKSKKSVQLSEEIKHAEAYLNIQKMRYPNNFNYKMRFSKQDLEYEIPSYILQPILENAFKHSLLRKKWNFIGLYTEKDKTFFTIHIVDNGNGAEPEVVSQLMASLQDLDQTVGVDGEHIGLQNVHYRIQLMFGPEYGVWINSKKDHWFKVSIKLPAKGNPDHGV